MSKRRLSHLIQPLVTLITIFGSLLAWSESAFPQSISIAASGVWNQVQTTHAPEARYIHGMAYDEARSVLVLFGGDTNGSKRLNDTWEFDGADWSEVQPSQSPPGRVNIQGGMVYDPNRQKVMLFGGLAKGGYLDDTWEFDGTTWVQVVTAHKPPARDAHAMVYDTARGVIILFGGFRADNNYLNDTWEYDGLDWRQITPPQSPAGRNRHAMTYDSQRGVVVLFGGNGVGDQALGDTWEYDGSTWQQVTTTHSPPARGNHGMAYDVQRGVTVLFGGTSNGADPLADTWEYNGVDWTNASPAISPGARLGFPMVYDPTQSRVLLFGGGYWDGHLTAFQDTWEFVLDEEPSGYLVYLPAIFK